MHNKRPPIPVVIIVVLVLLVGGYFLIRSLTEKDDPTLRASGSIQTVEVTVSPEIGGKVAEVLVSEGDPVQGRATCSCGWMMRCLQAQRAVAAANLEFARAAVSHGRVCA